MALKAMGPKRRVSGSGRQGPRRAIPGSLFTIQRAEVVYNPQALAAFSRLHNSGKLSLAFPLKDSLAKKHGLKQKSGRHWLVPFRVPSTPPQGSGLHERTLFAKIGNKEIALKGSGAPFDDILDLDDDGKYRVNRVVTPSVRWHGKQRIVQRKLWGGADMPSIRHEAQIANSLHSAFKSMLKNKDSVLKMAAVHGVKKMPTLEPIAIFKPLQVPVEYQPRYRLDFQSKKFIEHLSPKNRKTFEYQRKRNESLPQPKKAFWVKAPAKERLLGIPKGKLKEQALFIYSAKSQHRLIEANARISERQFRSGKVHVQLEDYNGVANRRSIECLYSMFRLNGFKLKPVEVKAKHSGEKPKTELVPFERRNGRWVKCSMHSAANRIINGFVTNLGVAIYVMHSGLRGSYSSIINTSHGERTLSSLTEQNLSIVGEPLDLDTARTNIKIREVRELLQGEDIRLAHEAIRKMAGILKVDAEKAISAFEKIRTGKLGKKQNF